MWNLISLRIRIYVVLVCLVFITFAGALVMVWYTYRMQGLLTRIIERNVPGFQAAQALETLLEREKWLVTFNILDNHPDLLNRISEYRLNFKEWVHRANALAETEPERSAISQIESEYLQYIASKDKVISYFKEGRRKQGEKLYSEVRSRFFKTLDLCEGFKSLYMGRIKEIRDRSHVQAMRLRIIAGTAMFIVLLLGVILAMILMRQILGPIRTLALEADQDRYPDGSRDEVKALKQGVRGLIKDVNYTRSELKKSRETLLQAEKMALVGKLAAGMAHSIRNPLTSVKMRLFSLDRSLDLSAPQKEDFEVISEEIRHVDTVVENFLEFSRPPKLRMRAVGPSDVVDLAIRLLSHRLESYNVDIRLIRHRPLPEIQGDPEQLKEVLVNIVVNACEAMEGGGTIVVQEEEGFAEPLGRVAVIRLTDNGPGIPEFLQDKILQPFFTTKEEGTGLGLSIAARIVEEHGGWLDLSSKEGEGSAFVITLPIKGVELEHHLDN